ncbi:MAG TPA: nitroreductase family deazaflavin-dependent oxidoreductase [Ktedonobacteraceae bacterium]|jgi:deazaflavin-dependent oxidoreductase (nitroreductase family)|nr:nitroreductase family deazaflavin-dependent oxidoreductase [Ktedonobacteraceae bacterium]
MNNALSVPSKPKGLLKWLFRLPRYLYRWHLGWLLGHRFLLLTHLGRKSGRSFQTVLEVVRYDPQTRECVIIAGYGAQSDWYRNLQAHPALAVQVGRQHYTPQQRMLSTDETEQLLAEYQRRYPRAFGTLMHLIGYTYDGTPQGLRTLSELLRGVSLRP